MRFFIYLALFITSLTYASETDIKNVYALLLPVSEAELSSELNATIKNIYLKPGQHFKKNQTLLTFDCRPIDIELKQVNATLKATHATLVSNQNLAKRNAVSRLDLKLSESEHEKMLAKKELLQHQQEKCTLNAPFDGEVVALQVNPYESVQTNTPLLSIIDNHNFEIQMYIPSIWFHQVRVGTIFELSIDEVSTPKKFKASITKVVSKIDAASQSILVFGKLLDERNKEILSSGMSGLASFQIKEQ